MKTAIQELIEFIDFSIKHCHDNERIRIHQLVVIKERAKECLEKEKEQIVNAFEQGIEFAFPTNGSYYYNQTYKQTNSIEVDAIKSQVTTTGVWTPKTN